MKNAIRSLVLLGALTLAAPSAHAVLLSFSFNSLADGANNAAVQTYLQAVVTAGHPGGAVTITGSQAEKNYTGDNHVVGPVSGALVSSETLGTSNGGLHHAAPLDTFLINQQPFTTITMTFSFPIYGASFDYEIFPDGTCQSPSCGASNWPDFTFEANDVVKFRTLGIVPGQSGTRLHSPISGPINNERAPQFLGLSGTRYFPSGVTKLEFIDWPRTIGIDNLMLNDNRCDVPDNCPPPPSEPVIPEPHSLLLMATGLSVLRLRRPRS